MLQMQKNHFYLDTKNRLVQVISDKVAPFDLFLALAEPKDPRSNNLYFVRSDGVTDGCEDLDLMQDVTCLRCRGRGNFLTMTGPDEAVRHVCYDCGTNGHMKLDKS